MSRPLAVLEGTSVGELEGTPKSIPTQRGEYSAVQLGSEHTDGMQQYSAAAQWVAPAAAQQTSRETEERKDGGNLGENLKNLPWLVEKEGEKKETERAGEQEGEKTEKESKEEERQTEARPRPFRVVYLFSGSSRKGGAGSSFETSSCASQAPTCGVRDGYHKRDPTKRFRTTRSSTESVRLDFGGRVRRSCRISALFYVFSCPLGKSARAEAVEIGTLSPRIPKADAEGPQQS